MRTVLYFCFVQRMVALCGEMPHIVCATNSLLLYKVPALIWDMVCVPLISLLHLHQHGPIVHDCLAMPYLTDEGAAIPRCVQ